MSSAADTIVARLRNNAILRRCCELIRNGSPETRSLDAQPGPACASARLMIRLRDVDTGTAGRHVGHRGDRFNWTRLPDPADLYA